MFSNIWNEIQSKAAAFRKEWENPVLQNIKQIKCESYLSVMDTLLEHSSNNCKKNVTLTRFAHFLQYWLTDEIAGFLLISGPQQGIQLQLIRH